MGEANSRAGSIEAVFFDLNGTLGAAEIAVTGEVTLTAPWTAFRVFPVAKAALESLREGGLRLGIVADAGATHSGALGQIASPTGSLDSVINGGLCFLSGRESSTQLTQTLFESALGGAGLRSSPQRALYVSANEAARALALDAGFQVCRHVDLVNTILAGESLHLIHIALSPGDELERWSVCVATPGFAVMLFAADDTDVYGVAGDTALATLKGASLEVETLGTPGLVSSHEIFLLRDESDVASQWTRALEQGLSGLGLQILSSTTSESGVRYLVSRPAARNDQPLFLGGVPGLRFHRLALRPATRARFTKGTSGSFPQLATPGAIGNNFPQVTAQELNSRIGLYSGARPLMNGELIESRHIAHRGNARAVIQVAQELLQTGLKVRLKPFAWGLKTLYNVEAELLGSGATLVLVSAHLDSTADLSPSYTPAQSKAPGADDDASGMAAVTLLAAATGTLANNSPPERTLRFVLFNAEEQGRLGSVAYANAESHLGSHIAGVFQMDMIAYNACGGQWRVLVGDRRDRKVEAGSRDLADVILRQVPGTNSKLGNPTVAAGIVGGSSDHGSFHLHGYPAVLTVEYPLNGVFHTVKDAVSQQGFDAGFAAAIAQAVGAAAWVLAR
jgi:hypothetical protein